VSWRSGRAECPTAEPILQSARRNRPFLSIRARLIVLALLAIAPLMLARLHELESARLSRLNAVNAEVIDLARRGVESQRDIIYSVRALLQTVSRLYARILSIRPTAMNIWLI
jgi:hypothetical protein